MNNQAPQSQTSEPSAEARKATVLLDTLLIAAGIYLWIQFPQRWWGGALGIALGLLMLWRDWRRLRKAAV